MEHQEAEQVPDESVTVPEEDAEDAAKEEPDNIHIEWAGYI